MKAFFSFVMETNNDWDSSVRAIVYDFLNEHLREPFMRLVCPNIDAAWHYINPSLLEFSRGVWPIDVNDISCQLQINVNRLLLISWLFLRHKNLCHEQLKLTELNEADPVECRFPDFSATRRNESFSIQSWRLFTASHNPLHDARKKISRGKDEFHLAAKIERENVMQSSLRAVQFN